MRTGCSNSWSSIGVILGELSGRPKGHMLQSNERVGSEIEERHVRCAKCDQCQEDTP